MSDQEPPGSPEEQAGRERRQEDRRQAGRRGESRRPPAPIWRRPAALVAYGALGALAVFLILRPGDTDDLADDESQSADSVVTASGKLASPASFEATREAFTVAQYERLIAEGVDAVGEVVRTELYCGSISQVTTSEIETPTSVLAPLKDAEGRVAGAECRWSQEARTSDFLLVVPSDLAEEFARAPEVELDFVRRRVIPADVEWLGRTEALSLRTAGVLRNIR